MIRQVIRGAAFRRDAYLRAVIGSSGTGDAVVIVAGVYVILALTISIRATTDLIGHARFVLNGGFAWLILSGIVYLIARHGFHGEGSFQGMVAMSALAHPVLVLLVLAQIGEPIPLTWHAQPTLLPTSILDLGFPGAVVVILTTMWFIGILTAGTRVAMSLTLDRAIASVAGGYAAWWVIGSLLGL